MNYNLLTTILKFTTTISLIALLIIPYELILKPEFYFNGKYDFTILDYIFNLMYVPYLLFWLAYHRNKNKKAKERLLILLFFISLLYAFNSITNLILGYFNLADLISIILFLNSFTLWIVKFHLTKNIN